MEIIANGYYFNEITGEVSSSPITLRSISDLTETGRTNVNLLTTLESDRIRYLVVNEGLSVKKAREMAEKEVFALFHIPNTVSENSGFDKMDITQNGENNAVLLAISATLQCGRREGELSELISKIAAELSASGKVSSENILEQIRLNGMEVDADAVRENLVARYDRLGLNGYVIPPFEDYLDINGNGIIDKNDSWLIVDGEKTYVLSSEGGTFEVNIAKNVDFSCSIEADLDGWITQIETKSYLEYEKLYFTVSPNETYDDRYAIIRIASGTREECVNVIQKQKDAITLSSSKIDIGKESGTFEVEVLANVNYDVEIQSGGTSWLSRVNTKGLSSNKETFSAKANEDVESRSAKIVFRNGNISESITVCQTGEKNLVISQKEYFVSSEGGTVTVEVSSNFDYTISNDNSWISETSLTKGIVTGTRTFLVAENADYDARKGYIVFSDDSRNLAETVIITQAQKDAIVISSGDEYTFTNEGGELTVGLLANVQVTAEIPETCQSWISQIQTRGLDYQEMRFVIDKNTAMEDREGSIVFRCRENGLSQTVKVIQTATYVILVQPDTVRVNNSGANPFTIQVTSNVDYSVSADVNWITSYSISEGFHNFKASYNESTDERTGCITFYSNDNEHYCPPAKVIVIQEPKNYLGTNGETSFNLPCTEGELETSFLTSTSTDYKIQFKDYYTNEVLSSEPDWIWIVPPTRAIEVPLTVHYQKNEAFTTRGVRICISYTLASGAESSIVFSFLQARNDERVEIHVPQAGTLNQIISVEDLMNIVNLKITGELNTNDLAIFDTPGGWPLEILDLSEVNLKDGVINCFGSNYSSLINYVVSYVHLREVYLPSSLIELGGGAFRGCSSLEKVVFPEDSQLEIIGGGVMQNALGYIFPKGAFSDCISLRSISLPASLHTLGGGSFAGCTSLESVSFADNGALVKLQGTSFRVMATLGQATYVYMGLFMNCPSLKSIDIPASVKSIGSYAFKGCSGLETLVIPDTVTELAADNVSVFEGCSSLKDITLPKCFDKVGKSMFKGCSSLTPAGIHASSKYKEIADYGFQDCKSMVSIDLSAIDSIGVGAFSGSGLESISFPDNITEVPEALCQDCVSLTKVNLNKCRIIGPDAFRSCTALEEISLPETIEQVGSYAFFRAYSLSRLEILCKNLEFTPYFNSGSSYAFGSTNITSITIPRTLVSIKGLRPFGDNLNEILFEEGSVCEEFGVAGGTSISSIELPPTVKILSDNAFISCSNLRRITLPDALESIGTGAFNGTSLRTLTFPSGLCTIGSYAFANTPLTSISIESPLESIGSYAFDGCTSIDDISIKSSASLAVSYLLSNCSCTSLYIDAEEIVSNGVIDSKPNLKTFIIGKNVKKVTGSLGGSKLTQEQLPSIAFEDGSLCEELSGVFSSMMIKGIVLPPNLKIIGKNTFSGCTALTSLSLPESLTSIGERAFYGCTGLTALSLPESLTTIGNSSFYGCTGLTSMVIPDAVTSLDYMSFGNCTNLASVTIPGSLTSLGNMPFYGCTGLNDITFCAAADGSSLKLSSGIFPWTFSGSITIRRVLTGSFGFEETSVIDVTMEGIKETGSVFASCKSTFNSLTLPDGLETISASAFDGCSGLKSITIPNSVTSIGNYAFRNCKGLTSLNLSEGLTSIGGYAFQNCTGLASVTIPGSIATWGTFAFYGCTGLTSLNFSETLASIGDYTFQNCTSLASVTIPGNINTLGVCAFYGCTGLDNITFGAATDGSSLSVKSVFPSTFSGSITIRRVLTGSFGFGETSVIDVTMEGIKETGSAFASCYANFNSLKLDGLEKISVSAFDGCPGLKSIVIPDSVTSVGTYAFRGCSNLTSLIIPGSVTSIGAYAFAGCSGLASLNLSEGLTSIGKYAFLNCTGLASITIPGSITTWGNYAFSGCIGLTTLNLSEGLTSIGSYAFQNCTGLASVVVPDTVTSIGSYAFQNCTGLQNIQFGKGCNSISMSYISGSTNIESISFPETCTRISWDSGLTLTALKNIYVAAVTPPSLSSSASIPETATIYVPSASVTAYVNATTWKNFSSTITGYDF